jgi:hypothetical protein
VQQAARAAVAGTDQDRILTVPRAGRLACAWHTRRFTGKSQPGSAYYFRVGSRQRVVAPGGGPKVLARVAGSGGPKVLARVAGSGGPKVLARVAGSGGPKVLARVVGSGESGEGCRLTCMMSSLNCSQM